MRIPLLTFMAAVGLIAFASADRPATAQEPPASASSAPAGEVRHQPEVIITGDRAEFQAKIISFVNELTEFNLGDPGRGLARWQESVCPLVTGLPQKQGEYILGRVSDVAQAAGAPLGGEKCHPNLFIIITTHPEADLRDLEKRHRENVFGGAAQSLIDGFITSPRPVRTWYDTVERTPEGMPMLVMSFPGISQQVSVATHAGVVENFPVRPNVNDATLTNPWSQASHLALNVVWAIQRVFVIVDPTRFKGVSLGQLADYVAMSGLAQIKLDAHLAGDPTILALFDTGPQAASAGLTDWDRAFLKSVYESEQKSVLLRSQLAHDMVAEIAP